MQKRSLNFQSHTWNQKIKLCLKIDIYLYRLIIIKSVLPVFLIRKHKNTGCHKFPLEIFFQIKMYVKSCFFEVYDE